MLRLEIDSQGRGNIPTAGEIFPRHEESFPNILFSIVKDGEAENKNDPITFSLQADHIIGIGILKLINEINKMFEIRTDRQKGRIFLVNTRYFK